MVSGIVGYGVYIPWCRIKLSDIAEAWGRNFKFPVEKAVPFYDEDAITMASEAAQNAIEHAGVDSAQIGAVFLGTTTNPYLEKQGSSILASTIGAKPEAMVADFTGSARSSTQALIACLDALNSGRIDYGLVVGADMLVGPPGDFAEYLMSSGAGALVIGQEEIIAEVEGSYSYTTEFTEKWRSASNPFPKATLERFARNYGYVHHVVAAGKGLMENLRKKPEDFKHAVFSQPDLRYPSKAAREFGLSQDQIAQGMVAQFVGYTGASSLLVGLATILDKAKPKERILAVSYANGGSDAFSVRPLEKIEEKRQDAVGEYLNKKKYVNYATYLRYNRIFDRIAR
ncbi:MAG: hydroxymethylglutaryl-CoA synthase [Candidatus Bathyarchaeia archaeon]